jgi:hypothetical protein
MNCFSSTPIHWYS